MRRDATIQTGALDESWLAECRTVNDPALYPHLGGQIGQRLGHSFLERLSEERAATIAQSFDGQKELGAAGDPLPLVQAQAAARYQIVDVRMIFKSSRPGVQYRQQA